MSANCPLCQQQLQDETYYIRWFSHKKGEHRLYHGVFKSTVLFTSAVGELGAIIGGAEIRNGLIVGLQTGIIYRNNSSKAVPEFVEEPLLRAGIANGAELPPIYKKDKKKQPTNL